MTETVPVRAALLGVRFIAPILLCFATLSAPAGAQARPGAPAVPVAGYVQDQTGGMLPGAEVTLRPVVAGIGGPPRMVTTNDGGLFRFDDVPAGTYELRAQFQGFTPTALQVRVGSRAPGRQKLTLEIAGLAQEVTVATDSAAVTLDPTQNRDGVSVDKKMLADMPAFDRNYLDAVSAFLDPGAAGTGGTTLVVDGMEGRKVGVSASAIEQIKINQDPYAAEYARPGGGRVEVITKAGSEAYHGEFNLTFRDGALNARNAFSDTRPTEQRRIYEGMLSGPILDGRTTSFMLSVNREETDQQAIVFAQDPAGPVRLTMATPQRNVEVSATVNRQQGKKQTLSFRVTYQSESARNEGVGGTSLPDAASNSANRELQLVFSHRAMLTGTLVNQFRLLVGGDHQTNTSLNQARRIVVQDAFTGGGAQVDQFKEERHFTLSETIAWSRTQHTVKAGVSIPDWSRRRFDDRGNFGGTFSFSSLDDYAHNRPYVFTQQQGDGRLVFLQKVFAAFVQDDIAIRRNLSVAIGLRYDWQNFFVDNNNVASRISFAWAPGSNARTVVRGGFGIFYDRTGTGPMHDVEQSREGHLLRYTILNPGYPDPLGPGATIANQPTSLVQFSPAVHMPYTAQFGVGVEQQLAKSTTLAVTYTGTRGVDLFLSRDINAPPPPLYLTRPDPTHGTIRDMEAVGRQWSHSLQFTLRGRMSRLFGGSVRYVLSRAQNDTSGINSRPANDYDLTGEWALAEFDERHRFDVMGAFTPWSWCRLGVNLSLRSGRPYSLRTGRDDYNNGTANARPAGVPRNSLEGPGSARLDLRWSREIELRKGKKRDEGAKLTLGVDAFNVLNRVNYNGYVGNLSSPFFGQPVSAQPARRLQLSARLEF
ncbi:MAG TPA: carboxypeptidase regulatory-like domain-containing protein [Vicinamibacterales bacterium]|jgi:outer membrane receptor protein involved in Fe transport